MKQPVALIRFAITFAVVAGLVATTYVLILYKLLPVEYIAVWVLACGFVGAACDYLFRDKK